LKYNETDYKTHYNNSVNVFTVLPPRSQSKLKCVEFYYKPKEFYDTSPIDKGYTDEFGFFPKHPCS